jgi:hypothetical protein
VRICRYADEKAVVKESAESEKSSKKSAVNNQCNHKNNWCNPPIIGVIPKKNDQELPKNRMAEHLEEQGFFSD